MNKNSIDKKNVFKIALYDGCPVYGKLFFDKEKRGFLQWFDNGKQIEVDLDNYNKNIINSIIYQSNIICAMKHGVLWHY